MLYYLHIKNSDNHVGADNEFRLVTSLLLKDTNNNKKGNVAEFSNVSKAVTILSYLKKSLMNIYVQIYIDF